MVLAVEKFSFRLASCCRLDVVNGGWGRLSLSPCLHWDTVKAAFRMRFLAALASASL